MSAPKLDADHETERIRARAAEWEGKAHDFVAAKWTHSNGHPRCSRCGREEPVGGKCDGDTHWKVRADARAEHKAKARS